MKKLMAILLATVMCVTCGGIDCSAARAKAFSRRTHSSSSRGSSSSSCSRSRGSSWFGPRKRSIWSSSSSSGSSCGSCASNKSDVIVVNNNNNNVAQNKSADKEKEVIIIEGGKDNSTKAVVFKGQKETNNDGILWGTLALFGGILLASVAGVIGYSAGLGEYKQDNADYENCLHSWENLKRDVFEYWTPEKYKNMTERLQKEIFNKFKVFDKECMTEE